jgi:hypothetical protein
VIFIVVLILTCGLSTFVGVAEPLGSFAHDTFFLLDNAYRVAQGQIPHRDFSSAWGPIMFLIDAGGLYLSKMEPTAFGYANALFGGLIAIWAFLIVRPRWPAVYACALGIYTLFLIVAPFPIGIHPLDFGYAMSYNRYGYAIFGLIVMECAADAPSARASALQRTCGAFSTGVALGLLAFLKISYAFAAIPFIVILTIASGGGYFRRFLGLGSGFLLLTFLVLCYLRFDISDTMTDLAIAAAARQTSLHLLHRLSLFDAFQCFLILLFAADLAWGAGSRATTHDRVARLHGALFAVGTVGTGYLLLISNQQWNTFPLNAYAAMGLVAAYGPVMTGRFVKWRGFSEDFSGAFLMAVCFLPFFLENGASLAGAAVDHQWPVKTDTVSLPSAGNGASLQFRSMVGRHKTETTGADYVDAVEDGMALLRRHSGDRDGILTFDEFNPFNYLLDRPSPRGGMAAAADDYIFSDTAHPTAERFLGDTRYVMIRKYDQSGQDSMERGDVDALMRIYGPALRSHFAMVEETKHWALWRRDDPPADPGQR